MMDEEYERMKLEAEEFKHEEAMEKLHKEIDLLNNECNLACAHINDCDNEIERLSCENERLKGEGELADKVIADFSCEGERKNAVIEQARKLLEGFRDSDNFFAFGDLEAAIVDLDSVSEGLKQK